jgi:hypothetical protein
LRRRWTLFNLQQLTRESYSRDLFRCNFNTAVSTKEDRCDTGIIAASLDAGWTMSLGLRQPAAAPTTLAHRAPGIFFITSLTPSASQQAVLAKAAAGSTQSKAWQNRLPEKSEPIFTSRFGFGSRITFLS